jgi:hypothetical protein
MAPMKDALDNFERTIESASQRLSAISEGESAQPRADGKWSAKEIIGHLIDSAANNHQRFVRAQFTDELIFQGYEQEAWVRVQGYNEEPWERLVGLWKNYNLHLMHLMRVTPEAALTTPCRKHNLDELAFKAVDRNDATTLEYFMRDYIDHLNHHLAQIFS